MEIKPILKELCRKEWHPQDTIENNIQGESFDYYYTGMREGPSGHHLIGTRLAGEGYTRRVCGLWAIRRNGKMHPRICQYPTARPQY